MRRIQVMLDDGLWEALRAIAERDGKSVSEVAREILAALQPGLTRMLAVGEGPSDLARNHDRYLYGYG